MTWSLEHPSGVIAQFKVNNRSTVAAHSDRFILVTSGTKFVNVFLILAGRNDGKEGGRFLRHLLCIACYDAVTAVRMVCPPVCRSGAMKEEEAARIFVVTRGGDLLTLTHPLLSRRLPRKRRVADDNDDGNDDDANGNPTTIKLTPNDKFYSTNAEVVGFGAASRGGGVAVVAEKGTDCQILIRVFRRVNDDGGFSLKSSFALPELVSAQIHSVDVTVVSTHTSPILERHSANDAKLARRNCRACPSCLKVVDDEFFRRLFSADGRNRETRSRLPVSTRKTDRYQASLIFLFAFDSGQVFTSLFDVEVDDVSAPIFFADFHRSLVHAGVVLGSGGVSGGGGVVSGGGGVVSGGGVLSDGDSVNDVVRGTDSFLLGVSDSGVGKKLALDAKSQPVEMNSLSLPDSPEVVSSACFQDVFFCSKSFFYVVDPTRPCDQTVFDSMKSLN